MNKIPQFNSEPILVKKIAARLRARRQMVRIPDIAMRTAVAEVYSMRRRELEL